MEAYDLLGRTLTVSEANGLIHDTIDELFYEMSIEGEISGFRPSSTGHWYFTLKDSAAAIDCAVFRNAQHAMVMPDNGDLVVAKGSLSYYARNGRLTFVIREMHRKGEGRLMEIIEKRKEYYRSLGWFDEDAKKPIPEEISRLGVITSPTGAAIRDILTVTKRRAPSLDIIIFPAAVQGEGAAEEIAKRIRQANAFDACSVLIVGRGGGSAEDLSCFSEPAVIEAIHDSAIPIISAVGHEIDWPISDYAADRRAPTPSAAAEIVTETIFRRRERLEKALLIASSTMQERLSDSKARLRSCLYALSSFEGHILSLKGSIPSTDDLRRLIILRMRNAEARLGFSEEAALSAMNHRISDAWRRIRSSSEADRAAIAAAIREAEAVRMAVRKDMKEAALALLSRRHAKLEALIRETEALSPLSILQRGYSVTSASDGRILRSAGDAKPGDTIATRLADGMIESVVKETI